MRGVERILLVKQRGAVLEVIRRLNPVKCVQAHRVFLRDNSCLFQCVCHISFIYLFIFISPSRPDNIVLPLKWDFTFISWNEDGRVTINPWWSWKRPCSDVRASPPASSPARTPPPRPLARQCLVAEKTTEKKRRLRGAHKHSWISMRRLMDGYLLQITRTTEQKAFFVCFFCLPPSTSSSLWHGNHNIRGWGGVHKTHVH